MCDVGYSVPLVIYLGLPLCSRLRPDVCDSRQTDGRQTCISTQLGHNSEHFIQWGKLTSGKLMVDIDTGVHY